MCQTTAFPQSSICGNFAQPPFSGEGACGADPLGPAFALGREAGRRGIGQFYRAIVAAHPAYAQLLRRAQQCQEAGIDAINIPDGPRASARISPLLSAIEVEQKIGIETILHYTCRDRNLLGIQADLLGGYASVCAICWP